MEEEDEDEKGPNPPMMVPVADILNHVANHNAHLEYSPVSAEAPSRSGSSWSSESHLHLARGSHLLHTLPQVREEEPLRNAPSLG